jgi:hypothetical protein
VVARSAGVLTASLVDDSAARAKFVSAISTPSTRPIGSWIYGEDVLTSDELVTDSPAA